ncbi:hypothetical protein DEO72_LG8g1490 [Vigna unguiculata]|uniref:Uncharacterized protein n=1 Tax=Vigna unguiculata TaxID=3917 RepID=A0A4D6MPT0_VIGUN|nr:hypothetical protein DEO72_LG8g1490 [Vigna unguiculata]
MAPDGAGRAARRKTSKTVAVATELKWRLVAQDCAPGGLLGFRPVVLWQHQADTAVAGNFVVMLNLID